MEFRNFKNFDPKSWNFAKQRRIERVNLELTVVQKISLNLIEIKN